MIQVEYSKKGTAYVWASDLHEELNILTPLRKWFPRMIEYGFVENEDYFQTKQKVSDKNVRNSNLVGRPSIDWAVHIEMAKHIAMIQRSARGKALRQYLINLDKKVEEGSLLSRPQLMTLFELSRIFGYFSVQEYLEKEHYNVFKSQNENWWHYRARILGLSTQELKEAMEAINKRYKNQRQALMHIDKYELVKRASFDLFKVMGKTDAYALNVSEFVKEIAKELKPEIYDDRNVSIEFKSQSDKKTIKKIYDRDKPGGLIDKF